MPKHKCDFFDFLTIIKFLLSFILFSKQCFPNKYVNIVFNSQRLNGLIKAQNIIFNIFEVHQGMKTLNTNLLSELF